MDDATATEITAKVPEVLRDLFEVRDGAPRIIDRLRSLYGPDAVAVEGDPQRVWELCGLQYSARGRFHEAIDVFASLYDRILVHEEQTGARIHKGMPLLWLSECHKGLGHPLHAKRYLVLAACEDAVRGEGHIDPLSTGTYFRLVWFWGMPDPLLRRYATEVWTLYRANTRLGIFPEWLLQQLDQDWMVEFPSPSELGFYVVNPRYLRALLKGDGLAKGEALERVAQYVLGAIPGCRTYRRKRSHSTDYDVVGVIEGAPLDFRAELGRYFLCECKDWSRTAGFTTFAKFCRVLDSAKARFGILLSRKGISGEKVTSHAARERLKVFQDRGVVVVVLSSADLELIVQGENLVSMLRRKYEDVRLDLVAER